MSLLLSLTAPPGRIEAAIVLSAYLPMMSDAEEVRAPRLVDCLSRSYSPLTAACPCSGSIATRARLPFFGFMARTISISRACPFRPSP